MCPTEKAVRHNDFQKLPAFSKLHSVWLEKIQNKNTIFRLWLKSSVKLTKTISF